MTDTVTTVTKVKVGRHTFQFDLSDNKLTIEYRHGKKEPVCISLGAFPLNTLRELLGVPFTSKLATKLPTDPLDVGKIVLAKGDDGLVRTGDGIESGMDE